MCNHILKANDSIIQCSIIDPLTPTDLASDEIKRHMKELTSAIYSGPLGPTSEDSDFVDSFESETPSYDSYCYNQGYKLNMPDSETFMVDAYNIKIDTHLCMPLNDAITEAKVVRQKRDNSGNKIRVSHSKLIQDTSVYKVASPYGTMGGNSANIRSMQ